jgi:hypothetical protein
MILTETVPYRAVPYWYKLDKRLKNTRIIHFSLELFLLNTFRKHTFGRMFPEVILIQPMALGGIGREVLIWWDRDCSRKMPPHLLVVGA